MPFHPALMLTWQIPCLKATLYKFYIVQEEFRSHWALFDQSDFTCKYQPANVLQTSNS